MAIPFLIISFLIGLRLIPYSFEQLWKDCIKDKSIKVCISLMLTISVFIYILKPQFNYYVLWLNILFILAFVDLRHQSVRVYDLIFLTISLMPILAIRYSGLLPEMMIKSMIGEALVTLFFASGLIALKYLLRAIYKQNALGGADIWVMLTILIAFGGISSIIAIYASIIYSGVFSLVSIVVFKKSKKTQVAFIPFLLMGVITSMFFSEDIYKVYISLIQ